MNFLLSQDKRKSLVISVFSKCSGEDSRLQQGREISTTASHQSENMLALGMGKVRDLLNEYIQKGCTGS